MLFPPSPPPPPLLRRRRLECWCSCAVHRSSDAWIIWSSVFFSTVALPLLTRPFSFFHFVIPRNAPHNWCLWTPGVQNRTWRLRFYRNKASKCLYKEEHFICGGNKKLNLLIIPRISNETIRFSLSATYTFYVLLAPEDTDLTKCFSLSRNTLFITSAIKYQTYYSVFSSDLYHH